jgi:hypothetical protein
MFAGAILNFRMLFKVLLLKGCTPSFEVLEVSIFRSDEVKQNVTVYLQYANFKRGCFLVRGIYAQYLMCEEYFLVGKGGRCVGLTKLPSSCASCL